MHLSYLRAFYKYANNLLERSSNFVQLNRFIYLLTKKEIELLFRAALDKEISLARLQKDIFKAGRYYIKQFMIKSR